MSQPQPFDRSALADATDLLDCFGNYATMEAEARAEKSREAGNLIHFCRWREAARTIALLAGQEPAGALH